MRARLTMILAIGACTLALVGPPSARAQGAPWCAHYAGGYGGVNCGFATYQQCAADLPGIGGWCERNMFYRAPDAKAAGHVRRPHRRRQHPHP